MLGPALPAVSKSSALCGPRYQSRSCQPMIVGSSGGEGRPTAPATRWARDRRRAGSPSARRDSLPTALSSFSALRTAVSVPPSHHLMSASVPGPKAQPALHEPLDPSATPDGDSSSQPPRHRRPARARGGPHGGVGRADDPPRRRQRGQHPRPDRHRAAPRLPLAVDDRALQQRDLSRSSEEVASRPSASAASTSRDASASQRSPSSTRPASRRRGSAVSVLLRHPAARPRLRDRQRLSRKDEQGPPHRQVLDERPLLVQRAVHVLAAHAVHARPRGGTRSRDRSRAGRPACGQRRRRHLPVGPGSPAAAPAWRAARQRRWSARGQVDR